MIQDTCPNTEQLQRLLSEQLEPQEEADLAIHIEQCEHCHQELERLTTSRGSCCTDTGIGGPATIDPGATASHGWVLRPEATAQRATVNTHALPAIPGYELLDKLGEGGMGVVYLARQTGLNRRVAVKMIRGGSQAQARSLRPVPHRGRGRCPAPPPQHHSDP